jgi:DnaK suppressor protein
MKTKKTQAKKLVKPKPVVKAAAKSASKKTVAAKKPAPARTGLIKKLQNALKGKSAAKAAKPATAAKKKPTPAKPAARPTPKKVAKPLAGKAKVPNKGKPQKTAVAASTVTKPAAKSKPVAAPKPARTAAKRIVRPVGSVLSEDDIREMSDDDYMDDAQLNFFRLRLIQMREEVLQREMDVKERLHEREVFADPADRATAEEEHWLDLRLRERESLLLKKIDEALRRIEAKEYGYCEKTGDPIGIPRLLARPTATVCVDVKGQDERVEAQFRDR